MPKHIILKFPLPPASLDPLEVSVKQEEQIWCLNINNTPLFFGTLAIFALQCSFMSLSLASKLKLNT